MEIVTLHLTILAVTALVILYADHVAFSYFRGTRPVLDARLVWRLHTAVWVGLIGMIGTGVWMAYPGLSVLLAYPPFLIKMGFVGVLVLNSLFITSLIGVATTTPYAQLTLRQKAPLILSGALSTIGWLGAATMGFYIFG